MKRCMWLYMLYQYVTHNNCASYVCECVCKSVCVIVVNVCVYMCVCVWVCVLVCVVSACMCDCVCMCDSVCVCASACACMCDSVCVSVSVWVTLYILYRYTRKIPIVLLFLKYSHVNSVIQDVLHVGTVASYIPSWCSSFRLELIISECMVWAACTCVTLSILWDIANGAQRIIWK